MQRKPKVKENPQGSNFYKAKGLVGIVIWVTPEFREQVNKAIALQYIKEGIKLSQSEFIEAALTKYMEEIDA